MPVQTTINTVAPATYLNKTFYDRKLLEIAKTKFVFNQFAQKRPIPRNNGKTVEFRRFNLFTPDLVTNKLTEGVTPDSQSISQSKVEATVEQYGAYVEVSDLLDMTAYDPLTANMVELLGEQMGTLIDWIDRDALVAGASDQFANGRTKMNLIEATDKLTIDEVRKAVRTLKKNKARMFGGGRKPHFVCICSPDATYDLQGDQLWQDVSKYSNAEAIYSGEIGRMFGVVFVESTEAYVSEQSVHNYVANVASDGSFSLQAALTPKAKAYLSVPGNKIYIGSDVFTLADEPITYSGTTAYIHVRETGGDHDTGDLVYSDDAGKLNAACVALPVHHSIVIGADAYGDVDVDGSGAIQSIIKPAGSGGTTDPLDQRSTIAGKIMGYTSVVLNPLWIVDIQHAVSA